MKNTMLYTICLVVFCCSCEEKPTINEGELRQELLALHHEQRAYHFKKQAAALVNVFSEDFVSVNKGAITQPTKAESLEMFSNYFDAVEFLEWDDIAEPIVRISADGSMAYTVVDKLVKVRRMGEDGVPVIGETRFAWTAIYIQTPEGWKLDCITSTNVPAS